MLPVYSLQFMPDDDRLWIGTGRSIVVLDPKTWQVQYRLPSLGTTPSQETSGAGGGTYYKMQSFKKIAVCFRVFGVSRFSITCVRAATF